MTLIYITCKNKTEAKKIGEHLLKNRLAGCVNIYPVIESVYWWKGKLVKDKESVLIVKAAKKNFRKIESEVKNCILTVCPAS
jgi:periplasmic divalent cation tolerance protein